MKWGVWRAFWGDLNTPSDFSSQPYFGALNQIGHIAIGREAVTLICIAYAAAFGAVPNAWFAALFFVLFYAVVIEIWRQKWVGRDTVVDSCFVAIGAAYTPLALQLTPSGRWVRTQEATTAVLVWIFIAVLALALYVYPRAKRRYAEGETARG
jgi:hypothetical protein